MCARARVSMDVCVCVYVYVCVCARARMCVQVRARIWVTLGSRVIERQATFAHMCTRAGACAHVHERAQFVHSSCW
jgi:hypothetical protein